MVLSLNNWYHCGSLSLGRFGPEGSHVASATMHPLTHVVWICAPTHIIARLLASPAHEPHPCDAPWEFVMHLTGSIESLTHSGWKLPPRHLGDSERRNSLVHPLRVSPRSPRKLGEGETKQNSSVVNTFGRGSIPRTPQVFLFSKERASRQVQVEVKVCKERHPTAHRLRRENQMEKTWEV